jgi:hypothetical protein
LFSEIDNELLWSTFIDDHPMFANFGVNDLGESGQQERQKHSDGLWVSSVSSL